MRFPSIAAPLHRFGNPWAMSFALAVTLAAAPGGASAFEGRVDYSMTVDNGKPMIITYRLKGESVRTEYDAAMGAGRGAMLYLPKEKATYMLAMDNKMAIRHPMDAGEAVQAKPAASKTTFQKTGRTETIAGQKCDVYAFESPESKGDVCAATDMGSFVFSRPGPKAESPEWARGASARALFPLRVTAKDRKGQTVNMLATRIERASQPAELFGVPADYQVVGGAGPAAGSSGAAAADPQEMARRMQNATPEEREKMIRELQKQYGVQ